MQTLSKGNGGNGDRGLGTYVVADFLVSKTYLHMHNISMVTKNLCCSSWRIHIDVQSGRSGSSMNLLAFVWRAGPRFQYILQISVCFVKLDEIEHTKEVLDEFLSVGL